MQLKGSPVPVAGSSVALTGPRFPLRAPFFINSVHTRCIVETSEFTRGVCKNRGFHVKFEGFLVEFREQVILRKSKAPRKSPEKWTFLSLPFYNARSLHTVDFIV